MSTHHRQTTTTANTKYRINIQKKEKFISVNCLQIIFKPYLVYIHK